MAEDAKMTKVTETHTTTTRTTGTPPPPGSAPVATTLAATAIEGAGAHLNGEVVPNKAATHYWFEYGTTPAMGHSSTPQPAGPPSGGAGNGTDAIPVAVALSGLEPAATYFFRLVAENEHGKTAGAQHSFQSSKAKQASFFSNIIAVIGFIILLGIIIWGLIHLATLASPWLSSIFNKKAPASIVVTVPAQAVSGNPFTVSWKYSPATPGSYAFLYQCKDNFQFQTQAASGMVNIIPCGAAFTVGASGNSVSVLPVLSGSATTSIPLSIIFIPSTAGAAQVQGNATVAIAPGATVPVAQTPVQPVTPAPKPLPVRPAGPASLAVTILSVSTSGSGVTVASFDIANVGGSPSGGYYFQAYLPTQNGYTYTSPGQISLAPGDHIISTLSFTQTVGGTFSVIVDPSSMVSDSNRSNNYASQGVSAPYNQNQYQYQNSPQYQYTY